MKYYIVRLSQDRRFHRTPEVQIVKLQARDEASAIKRVQMESGASFVIGEAMEISESDYKSYNDFSRACWFAFCTGLAFLVGRVSVVGLGG